MNEVNRTSLPAGRQGGVVEFIIDEMLQIVCFPLDYLANFSLLGEHQAINHGIC
jgi:hypothetical protein